MLVKDEVFDLAFQIILKFEGGYVYDPRDPGGETKYGISKRAYPNLDIKNLTESQAKEIYYNDYWIPAKCNLIHDGLNIYHFDTAVNMGLKRAAKFLQIAINRSSIGTIRVDGIIGPKTLAVLRELNPLKVLSEYAVLRNSYYVTIARKRNLIRFLKGWINRSTRCFVLAVSVTLMGEHE